MKPLFPFLAAEWHLRSSGPAFPVRAKCALACATWVAVLVSILVLGFTGVASVASGSPESDSYQLATPSFRHYTDSDGLPQNTIQTITVDTRGILWIGTQDGAAFFNGRTWQTLPMPSRNESNFVRTILPASDGSIWFGTRVAGLFRRSGDLWTHVKPLCDQPECARIQALAETVSPAGGSEIWAATYGAGIGRFKDSEWTMFTTAHGLPDNRLWGVAAERTQAGPIIWAGTEKGLAVLRPGSESFVTEPGFPTASVNSFAFGRPRGNERTMWVGTYGGGLHILRNGIWTNLTTADGLPSDFLTSLALSPSDEKDPILWAGTDGGGIFRLSNDGIEIIDTRSGLPSNGVYCLYVMSPKSGPGMTWVGTRNGGLAQLVDGTWRRFSPLAGCSSAPVNAIQVVTETPEVSTVWLGTDGEGLFRFRRGSWTNFKTELPGPIIQCLLNTSGSDGSPVLWVGTRTAGLARFAHGRWTEYSNESGVLPSKMIQALLETRSEQGDPILWVGTRHGLARLGGGKWTHFTSEDGLPNDSVLSLLETQDADGSSTLWAGTFDGLAVQRSDRWHTMELEPPLLNNAVQCLHEHRTADGRRLLWIGTDGGGVSVLDLDQQPRLLFTLTDATYPKLPSNVISAIVEDISRRIYLLTNAGVVRLTPKGPNSTSPHDYIINTYSGQDGLPLNEGNRGAATVDSDGRIWVGTVGGAAVLDPKLEREDRSPDPLVLDVRSGSEPYEILSPEVTLPHDRKHISFTYSLLSYFHQNQIRYQTQLVGLDDEPSRWTDDAKSEYRTLSKGHYVFRVWGRDFAGNITGPNEFSFSIRPALWETWWAYGVGLALAALVVFLIQQWRLRAIRERERRLTGLVDARTRRLEKANELLVELSYADSLTGVGNRRRFDELLQNEWKRALRSNQVISLVLIDIDHFKSLNDSLGHAEGDRCLREVAAAVADALPRSGDTVSRYGGDEFAVILPVTGTQGALQVAEILRATVEALRLRHDPSQNPVRVTVSCGVASLVPTIDDDPHELLNIADRGLYQAKLQGRNRIAAGNTKAAPQKKNE